MKKVLKYFTPFELVISLTAVIIIIGSSAVFGGSGVIKTITSIVGIFGVLFTAKGNPLGQAIFVVFSILYAIISFFSKYYGEMLTYLGMTMPMAIISLISWLKNPYKDDKKQVKINKVSLGEICIGVVLAAAVTAVFYFVLRGFGTANLSVSTLSVTTSFIAVYFTFKRSPLYALGYAVNDVVLVILWSLLAVGNKSYISVVICFVVFLAFDIYGFYNWRKMAEKQKENRIIKD